MCTARFASASSDLSIAAKYVTGTNPVVFNCCIGNMLIATQYKPVQQLNTRGLVTVTYFAAILSSEDAEANRVVHI